MSEGKITLYIASSLDGFIATEDGSVSWLEEFQDESEDNTDAGRYEQFFADIDCIIMGSKTYEQVLSFGEWPYERKPTHVVTRRNLPLANGRVELFNGGASELAQQLGQRYEHIWLAGGAQLAQAFLRIGSIDEIRLSIIPVLLGSGISLFGSADEAHELDLTGVTSATSNIVELQYSVET